MVTEDGGGAWGKQGDDGQRILAFSFKMIIFWRSNIYHGDFS